MRVIATAGHVDHGKSTLVLALSGTDPDRLAEEKARGLTIDLGFAFMRLPSGAELGFVDVPGHRRLVRNMLAGVGAVNLAMLVVAADEGWMPQTQEHAEILDVLGIEHGLVVVTKAANADADALALLALDLADRLAGSALARWPVIVTDARAHLGIDVLSGALDDLVARAPAPRDVSRPRLWVDRAFAIRGAGTVVTGTLAGGTFAVDDDVLVEPRSRRARIRSIESHGRAMARADAGARVALNLAGIDHSEVARGDAVVLPGQWACNGTVDVAVRAIPGRAAPCRGTVALHVGSGDYSAAWRLLDDEGGFARVKLAQELPLEPGDKVVVRSTGARATIAGAEVADVAPAKRSRDALARLARPPAERALAARPWLTIEDLGPLAGLDRAAADATAHELISSGRAIALGSWLVAREHAESLQAEIAARVEEHHRVHPLAAGIDATALAARMHVEPAQLRALVASDAALAIDRGAVRARSHDPAAARRDDRAALLAQIAAGGCAPASPDEIGADPELVRALVRDRLLAEAEGIVFAASCVDEARARIAAAVTSRGALTLAEIRDLLATTRRYAVALATRFDAEGVTRRRGDVRVPGPRAAELAEG